MPAFSPAELAHLAHLARLTLAEDQIPRTAQQLERILGLFEGLQQIDTSAVGAVLASFPDLTLTPRPDVPTPSLPREAALAPSGRRASDYIAVPRVLKSTQEEG